MLRFDSNIRNRTSIRRFQQKYLKLFTTLTSKRLIHTDLANPSDLELVGLLKFDPSDIPDPPDPSDLPEPSDPSDPSDPPEPSDPSEPSDPPEPSEPTELPYFSWLYTTGRFSLEKKASKSKQAKNGYCLSSGGTLIPISSKRSNKVGGFLYTPPGKVSLTLPEQDFM